MEQLQYHIGWSNAATQLVEISFLAKGIHQPTTLLQLPSWRPGRYELGNFAKNIRSIMVYDAAGNPLEFHKQSKDCWEVNTLNVQEIKVAYTYYAVDLNAGSTYLDDVQLYVNPVNCCMYIPERINEACLLELRLPENYQVAIDLPAGEKKNSYVCSSFDRLADAPFIASAALQHELLLCDEHAFHLWFMGDVQPDWLRLREDFTRFCSEQLTTMGPLPGKDYHFYFQILPTAFYHGVEHTFSTVCALGPGNKVFKTDFYDELLGVSSHELFHAWNIKTIRPFEMHPYDFTKENYSRLGWVYEGITTWYGDQFLLRSGVFDSERYLITLNDKLKRHFSSYGRFNQAVTDASFDTWLDGYVAGIPHRKTSIYVEGSLITFLIDSMLREQSNDQVSVDDLMRQLYEDARKGKAYSKDRLLEILKQLSGIDFSDFYANYIESPSDFEPLLKKYFERIGMQLEWQLPFTVAEHRFGFRIQESAGQTSILMMAPGSVAEQSGMMAGDQIIAVNGQRLANNWGLLSNESESLTLTFFSRERLKTIELKADKGNWFASRMVKMNPAASDAQKQAYRNWSKQDFPN
jgi:predicted metalloprotease with PDZ domain